MKNLFNSISLESVKPAYFIYLTAGIVFISEASYMLFADLYLRSVPMGVNALLDAFIQSSVVFIVVFHFFYKPTVQHIRNIQGDEYDLLTKEIHHSSLILDTSLDGFWTVDKNGFIQTVNEEYLRISGFKREEMYSSHVTKFEAVDDHDAVKDRIAKIIKHGEDRFLSKHRKKNGEIFDVELHIKFNPQLSNLFYVFIRDISEQVNQHQALSTLSSSYKRLLNAATHNGIIAVGSDGIITEFNRGAQNLLGYTPDEVVNIHTPLIFHDPGQVKRRSERLSYRLNRAIDGMDVFISDMSFPNNKNDWLFVKKDQTTFTGSLTVTKIYDEQNVTIGYLGVIEDITERIEQAKRFSALLHEQNAILDNGTIGIAKTENRLFKWVNHTLEELLGYEKAEIIGKSSEMLSDASIDFQSISLEVYFELYEKGYSNITLPARRKDGALIWVDLYGKLLNRTNNEVLWTFIDITHRKNAEHEIKRLAYDDDLTGLPNRRSMVKSIQGAINNAQKCQTYGAILYIDLDNFKYLNDTLGHVYGDEVLVQISQRIQASLTERHVLGRLGGDEFVVLMDGFQTESKLVSSAKKLCFSILKEVEKSIHVADSMYTLSASIGVATYGREPITVDQLLANADMAMFDIKRTEKNGFQFFDEVMFLKSKNRLHIESGLSQAIRHDEFCLHYQPQVNEVGNVIGLEALIRWNHPKYGLLSPAEFIPIAEDSNRIVQIGDWVLETACQTIFALKSTTLADVQISINLSAKSLYSKLISKRIKGLLAKYDIAPELLKIELTEAHLLSTLSDVSVRMAELSQLGVRFSLDDFGTGYSSLQYLQQLPIDELKIDRSFVMHIEDSYSDQTIARTIISMAQSLSLSVIAEGVETKGQVEMLKSFGCKKFQGFLYGRPAPLDAILKASVGLSQAAPQTPKVITLRQ